MFVNDCDASGRKVRDSEAEDEPTKDGASEAPDPMLTNAAMVRGRRLIAIEMFALYVITRVFF